MTSGRGRRGSCQCLPRRATRVSKYPASCHASFLAPWHPLPSVASPSSRRDAAQRERGSRRRPDSVSILDNDQQQIAAQRHNAIALDDSLKRVEARQGPRFPWQVDLEHCPATFGKMEVSFYKLTNGSFSPAHYGRMDMLPDVHRDRELIDDAISASPRLCGRRPRSR